MNYFEHHIGDYLRDTAHLSLLEHGVYRRLMDVYYTREAPLPSDPARLIGARSKEEREAVLSVLEEFFDKAVEGWAHKRCDTEIVRFKDKQRKAKGAADARWTKSERNADVSPEHESSGHAPSMQTHSEGNATRAPIPTPQTPITNSVAELPHKDTPRNGSTTITVEALVSEGIGLQHARDWLAVRKTKRLPLTATAWEKFRRDAARQGMALPAAVEFCAGKGWAGIYVEEAANGHTADLGVVL